MINLTKGSPKKVTPYWRLNVEKVETKSFWQKVKEVFARRPVKETSMWIPRDPLSIQVDDAQYKQMKNRILGVE